MTQPKPATAPTAFAAAINRYHDLSDLHSRFARTHSLTITLLISDDDGNSWTRETTDSPATLWPPLFATRTMGVITRTNSRVLTTQDGGQT